MPRLRTAKTKEEAAEVPQDQAIQIELGSEVEVKEADNVEPSKKVEVKQEVQQETEIQPEPDEITALKKQVEAFKQAEKTQKESFEAERRRAEEAIRRENELRVESTRYQEDALQAQYDAIVNGIEAARAEAESAQRELEAANINGDVKVQVEAIRKLSRAEANMAKLEDGKLAYEARIQQEKERPKQEGQSDPFERAIAGMPDPVKTWIRSHPEYMTNQRLNINMQKAHFDAVDEGHAFGSPSYLESVEVHLGMREKPAPKSEARNDDEFEDEVQPKRSKVVTQAPPTREVPSTSTGRPQSSKITLTPEQREIARLSGIDEITYAKNLQLMHKLKSEGHYNEGR